MFYDDFVKMLKSANIPHTVYNKQEDFQSYKKHYPDTVVYVKVNNSPNLGYVEFCSDWLFDKDGKLLAVGHWE